MTRKIFLGAFEELTPNFIANGWSNPRSDTEGFATLRYWQDMARGLDEGGFDFLFLAEAIGYPMRDDGSVPEAVIREAVQIPNHDPMTVLSALAATVDRLAFAVTTSTTAHHPVLNARALTSLDHFTEGRLAWNIVTSDHQQALSRILGLRTITPHAERYRRANEFLELSLRLWETGWEDDAVVYDKAAKTYADPSKVHRITHSGEFFDFDGYFTAIPSPQRTPFLLQAGTSPAGRAFAGRYAECVFIQDKTAQEAAATVADLRARAAANGRDRDDIKVIDCVSIVVGSTEAEARALREEIDATVSRDAAAALFMGWSGVDLSVFPLDATLEDVTTEVGKTALSTFQKGAQSPTVAEVLDMITVSFGGPRITGTPESVVDQIDQLVQASDLDGFLVINNYGGMPGYRDLIDHVMPLMRRRGLLPAEPPGGSMRRRILGHDSDRLPASHPGAQLRLR